MLPRLTLVTPSFNQARYLEETIRSVLAQRENVHEFFVLDGGSDDGSAAIVERYAEGIDYWVSQPDGGQAEAVSRGFERATGELLGWLNSDDVLLPGAAAAVRRAFAGGAAPDVVSGRFCQIDGEGRLLRCAWVPQAPAWWTRRGVTRICQPSTFFSRRLYEDVGGLDQGLECVLDTDLWYRMLKRRARWRVIPRYLAARRYHDATKGAVLTDRYAVERRLLAERHPEYRPAGAARWAGRAAFRAFQLASPGFWGALLATLRRRGRRLAEVGLP